MAQQTSLVSRLKDKLSGKGCIVLIVVLAFAGYVGYNEYIAPPRLDSIEHLKEALPLEVDDYTVLQHIEETDSDFIMTFVKDKVLFEGLTAEQRENALSVIEQNAPKLCKNPLLYGVVAGGKKLTVLLRDTNGAQLRKIDISSCPVAGAASPE